MSLFDREPEMLIPQLRDSLTKTDLGIYFVHTPFYVAVSDDPEKPSVVHALANEGYRMHREAFHNAVHAHKWEMAIFAHVQRPYRPQVFEMLADRMTDAEYWELAAEVWIDQENPEDFAEAWRQWFSPERPGREHLMKDYEAEALEKLPDFITVFRAAIGTEDIGLSWTTHFEVARWFAKRFGASHKVLTAKVQKQDVVAYWTRRNEYEVLVLDPKALQEVEELAYV